MQVGLLITNGGPHSAEKWAAASAAQIIQIGAEAKGVEALEGRKLELKIIDLLEDHHAAVQTAERDALKDDPAARLETAIDPEGHDLDTKVEAIATLARGTPFEAHFASDTVKRHVREVLASHFATSIHIERSWHRDRNPAPAA
ncbi:hypothetical protein CWB41_14050 [Methylovirgula ligni]|uniref:Uncharacterized protein n=1 Tax=Methylovirgula ligni TaxID=569860 RepID=A0A3D9YL34_9HYPH|nr:hypothetical protein [Methylovirgula ligni]QAY96716.1 hypothetical protein CWB41_14050 [Methylovirgula ligni]REF83244.1 hypothetical protein DES32_3160 [Methylovirgula ligni]